MISEGHRTLTRRVTPPLGRAFRRRYRAGMPYSLHKRRNWATSIANSSAAYLKSTGSSSSSACIPTLY